MYESVEGCHLPPFREVRNARGVTCAFTRQLLVVRSRVLGMHTCADVSRVLGMRPWKLTLLKRSPLAAWAVRRRNSGNAWFGSWSFVQPLRVTKRRCASKHENVASIVGSGFLLVDAESKRACAEKGAAGSRRD